MPKPLLILQKISMKGGKLARLLLSIVVLEILFFTGSDAVPQVGCSSARPSFPRWVNNWQQNFGVRCHTSYSIRVWQSQHRNCKWDRIRYFQCKYGPLSHLDDLLHYVNHYDKPLAFKCAQNGVIAGVRSTYSFGARDPRFSFRCCHKHGYVAHTCKHTVIINKWDQPMRYVVPETYFLVGAFTQQ
ncbi:hemagglutinin/amebocyte aggregation factor-like [Acropora millepora]|uniref:hemagglutinin/amebocyte aggregation factor-like n=1 Tax=Acropora millepora TaxID=45264 RepID=UPI001CF2870E|nr:hemagglutinin/amebocyte aggregation factor-like [Acropora millepora]